MSARGTDRHREQVGGKRNRQIDSRQSGMDRHLRASRQAQVRENSKRREKPRRLIAEENAEVFLRAFRRRVSQMYTGRPKSQAIETSPNADSSNNN